MLRGFDISHHNGLVDFHRAKAAGASFVFLKATQGAGFVDPLFAHNRAAALEAQLPSCPYHYFEFEDDPAAQVRHFLATTGPLHGLLLPALDIELDSNQRTMRPSAYVAAVMEWRHDFAAKVGRLPIRYTYRDMWQWMGNPDMSGSPLWLADYSQHPHPGDHNAKVIFWQESDHGSFPGVPGAGTVDLDVFEGTDLSEFIL